MAMAMVMSKDFKVLTTYYTKIIPNLRNMFQNKLQYLMPKMSYTFFDKTIRSHKYF